MFAELFNTSIGVTTTTTTTVTIRKVKIHEYNELIGTTTTIII